VKTKTFALAGIMAISAATQASAAQTNERWPRWYLGITGDMTFLNDSDITGASRGKLSFDMGGGGNLALGYEPALMQPFGSMRFEVETGYHSNGIDTATVGGVTGNGSGSLTAWTYMANAYYDFRNSTAWTPYVGGGVGGAQLNLGNSSGAGNTGDKDNVFAWQLMAGMAYAPVSLPMTDWLIGYRFIDTQDGTFAAGASKIKVAYEAHNIEAGVRLRF
jgi:OOP family OmpA-OmpF porin